MLRHCRPTKKTYRYRGRKGSVDRRCARRRLGDCYEIADGHLNRWIKIIPTCTRRVNGQEQVLDCKWVPLVKMLKAWNRHAGKPISLLPCRGWRRTRRRPVHKLPERSAPLLRRGARRCQPEWPDLAGYGPVSDQMTSEKRTAAAVALRKAEVDVTRAVRFEKEGRQGEALALWRDILGRYFPSA